ncbi:MAG: transcriptional regulator GutM [Actinomycetes bacterium]
MTYLTKLFIVIAFMWASQLALAYMQAKNFQKDIKRLRKMGMVATGMGGKRYRGGRAFVALSANDDNIVQDGLVLRGFTVFTKSKPLPQYKGFSLEEIISGTRVVEGEPKKVTDAAKHAAQLLRDHYSKI